MAQTEQVIIDIDTLSAERSVKELKDNIKLLRDALVAAKEGTDEYSKIVDALVEKETRLNQVMKAGKSQVEAAAGSYNALVNEMQALKKVWKETTDTAERAKLGKQINDINTQLKDLDASIGNNQRNVGNYTESIQAAFSSVGGSSLGLVSGIGGIDTAMKALSKNPLLFAFTTLASVVMELINAFHRNEEAMNALKRATAPFRAAMDGLNEVFDKLASGVATVVGWFTKLMEKYGQMTPEAKAYKQIVEDEIKLEQQREEAELTASENAMEAAELRAKAMDEENYSIQERVKFMEEAAAKELETAELQKQNAELQLSIAQQQLELHKDNKEWIDKVRDAQIELNNATANYNGIVRSTTKEINRLKKQGYQQAINDANELLKVERQLIEQEYKLAEEGSKEQLELAKELRKKDYDIQVKGYRDKIANKKLQERAIKLATEQFNKDMLNLEIDHQKKMRAARQQETETMVAEAATPFEKAKVAVERLTEEYNRLRGEMDFYSSSPQEKDIAWKFLGFESEDDFKQHMAKMEDDILAAKVEMIQTVNAENNEKGLMDILSVTTSQFGADFRPEDSKEIREQLSNYWKALIDDNEDFQKDFLTKFVNGLKLEGMTEEKAVYQRQVIYKALFDKLQETRKQYNDTVATSFIKDTEAFSSTVLDSVNVLPDVLEKMNSSNTLEQLAGQVSGRWKKALNQMALDADRYTDKNGEFVVTLERQEDRAERALWGIQDKLVEYIKNRFKDAKLLEGENNEEFIKRFWPSLPPDVQDAYIQALNNAIDAESAALDRRVEAYRANAEAIQSIMSDIFDIYKEDIDWQVKQGNITEEEGKRRFETLKAAQISEAVIKTLGGAVTAFFQGMEYGGIIGGSIQAAAAVTAGIAQIQKIAHTEYGSKSANGVGKVTSTATPTILNPTPSYTKNVTGEDEMDTLRNALSSTNLWVSVSDIDKKQKQNRVRVAETSW